ncbi:MAG: hypothetical protein COV91_04130 [Candidatus Taylorbacteria bacterium CG11_big_fil_rev_8_21_14_0_20_46_11]|uniref:Zinc finger CHC2-type domain-containing protein n=1 Tax=Candidatus Taylorbacteria bacterium CG11_big_fil_rev_8_21_14_0_20_46_11 TaxID=1975025 RepID=A0A2H0KB01_9BACT|nr:MAG: hypothetical protein COV91_04130 [Candidatus Taylorbacteria bacterium CG11_big_fil_rev_8_21_14_0_20_46_11]
MRTCEILRRSPTRTGYILQHYGLKGFKISGEGLIGKCPFHKGSKADFRISTKVPIWTCFGACNRGGNIIEFVSSLEGISLFLAKQKLGCLLSKP